MVQLNTHFDLLLFLGHVLSCVPMVTISRMDQLLQTWYVVKELGFLARLNGRTYLTANVCSSSSRGTGGNFICLIVFQYNHTND